MNDSMDMSDRLETLLGHYFQSHEPDPAFIAQLRPTLLTTASEIERTRPGFSWNWPRRNWRYAVATALLLIIVAVTVIGPARVWAQIENWIAYLPGLGRVELSGTRALEEPAVHSEGGISFQVEQFVASPSDTLIGIHITGLPLNVSPSSEPIYVQWEDPDGRRNGLRMRKAMVIATFPPCPSEECLNMQPDGYDLFLAYEPLPLDVNQIQILWKIYGMVPDAAPRETWTLDISLTQVSIQNAQNLFQPGYSPLSAEDSQYGIKVTVDRVFFDASQTVIDASVLVPEPAILPSPQSVSLSTDTGDLSALTYFSNDLDINGVRIQKIPPATDGAPTLTVWPSRWRFSPADFQASRMTLSIESINLNYDVQFQFDIETDGDPEVGTLIPLDVSFDVEGFPVHILQARIVMAPAFIQGMTKDVKAIEFTVDSASSADGKRLGAIWFSLYGDQVFVEPSIETLELSIGRLALYPDMVRDGKIRVAVDTVVLEQQGPWVITWDIPQEAD
ncbi:MAG: hypothetical protein DRI65_05100 [Chloroflexota bacterium]|nr:MAG: hypothetical protein DRI65_05100 [Chloroflexota bacterium]